MSAILDPFDGWRAVHLHEVADCSDFADGFAASGGHINPDGAAHGLLNTDSRGPKIANLPNVFSQFGHIRAEVYREGVVLDAGGPAPLRGRYVLRDVDGFAVVFHENEDDHRTQPLGGSGARIACAAFPQVSKKAPSTTRTNEDV
ncbi:MAG: superoxide dismutase family protein [Pseudomonadota bacterium]